MVTKTIIICLLLLMPLQAHRQHVHQRLVIEAYNLLKKWYGNCEIPIMMNNHGDYSNIGSLPWMQGKITTGAWREDGEDVANHSTDAYTNALHDTSLRVLTYFLYFGITELFGAGISYQFNNDYALGLKLGGYVMSGGTIFPNYGKGIGIKISRTLPYRVFNNISCEYMFLYKVSNYDFKFPLLQGGAFEANIGYENRNKGMLGLFWAIGVVANSGKATPLSILPTVKLGFGLNF